MSTATKTPIRIPTAFRQHTNEQEVLHAEGATVGEVLHNAAGEYAGLQSRLFKTPEKLNRFVNVYLNDEDIRFLENLNTPVKEGDEIHIVPAIAGG